VQAVIGGRVIARFIGMAARFAAFGPFAGAMTAHATAPNAMPHFDLTEINVEGSTLLPREQVEETVYPFLGPDKTTADIGAARAALEAAYQKAGYITVSVVIPQQRLSDSHGAVSLRVIERPVGRLRVVGAQYFVPSAVRAGAPSLAPGTVPRLKYVTRDLVGLNQLPDRTVQPALKPGRRPDTVDVDLDVTDKLPLHGTLELDNRYNADTSPLRLNASLTYDNFFQRGDSGTITYAVAPENVRDAEIDSASYLFHIPNSQMSLLLTYLHSNSNVTALGTTDVAGRGTSAGFRLLIPLGSTSNFSHSLSLGWDYKRYYELDTFTTTGQITSAPVTYYPLNAAYAAHWNAYSDKTHIGSSTDLNLSVELGVNHLGGDPGEFDNKRYDAEPGFSLLRASLTREEDLPYDIQLWGSIAAQLSDDSLVSSEQFALGGADTVRGYLEAETLGDYGVVAQTELRSPSIANYLGGPLHTWRFHLFGDTGVIGQHNALPETRTSNGLSSVGVGTRVNLWGYLNGSVQDAQALNNGPDTKAGTNRVLFRVYGEF
jgi:hemolysin activation/secretion protein